jgi:acyl carrier protein
MGSDVWQRVRQGLLDWLGSDQPHDHITEASRLRDDLGLSSLRVVDLVVSIEDEFDIAITDEDLVSLVTLQDVVETVERKLADRGGR